jgi:hypothetical protein
MPCKKSAGSLDDYKSIKGWQQTLAKQVLDSSQIPASTTAADENHNSSFGMLSYRFTN